MRLKILVTGGAGFIGSEIADKLVSQGNEVIVLDNLSTGKVCNIEHLFNNPLFTFINGDICDFEVCKKACLGVNCIIHQAAIVSVPFSMNHPIETNKVNVDGFLNILEAARINNVTKVVYASSSAVYGNDPEMPKRENLMVQPISPYALTKYLDELYAQLYSKAYNIETVGLRYFNVYGPRQDPYNAYSGVISVFFKKIKNAEDIIIYGDGEATRDFVYVSDVADANILAAISNKIEKASVYNIATSKSISINELAKMLITLTQSSIKIKYDKERIGDVKNSFASIDKVKEELDFYPHYKLDEGLKEMIRVLLK